MYFTIKKNSFLFSLQEKERQSLKDEKIRQMAMAQKQKMAQKNEQRLRLRA